MWITRADRGKVIRSLFRSSAFREELGLFGVFLAVLGLGTLVILNPAEAYIGPGLAFDQLGLRLAVGLGFGPTAVVPPLYPFYLSCFYGAIGYSHEAVLLSQVLLLAAASLGTALTVRHLGLGPRYAFVAAVLVGCFPQSLALVRHFSPALLLLFLWTTAVHAWTRRRPHPSWFEAVLAGVLLGVCLLGRFGLWIPSLVLLATRGGLPGRAHVLDPAAPRPRAGRPALFRALLAGLCLLLAVVPWMVRNSRLHDELVFVDTTWALRWRAETIPGQHDIDYVIPGRATRRPDQMPVLSNRFALGEIVGFACAHPVTLLRVWGRRAGDLLGFSGWNDAATRDRFPYEGPGYRALQALAYGALLALAGVWVVLLRARGEAERLLGRAWLALAFVGVVTGGIGDVRVLSLPLLVPLAMRGLWGLLVQLRVRLRARSDDPALPWSPWRAFENTDPWPPGVEPASRRRWLGLVVLVLAIWIHGLSGGVF